MANIGIVADYTAQLRAYFDKTLIAHAQDNLQLAKLAIRKKLPAGQGSNSTVTFNRRKATTLTTGGVVNDSTTGNAAVSTLTDGTPITARRDMADYETVTATLVQIGSVGRMSDQVGWQHLFNLLKDTIALFGEEAALYQDRLLAEALVDGALAGNKVYAGGATSSATLDALSQSAGKLTMDEVLKGATNVKVQRGKAYSGGYFYLVHGCQIGMDIQKDADWIDANNYASPENRIKGETGKYGSVKFVETNNPYKEDLGDAAEGTYDGADTAANTGYVSLLLGADAFGTVEMAGQSLYSPRITVLNQADKSDPLNQTTLVGWKAFTAAKVLNNAWYSVIRSKSTF